METNPNITRLLEMLDNPEVYSEQEINGIINSDDETREAYRLMTAAKQGYRMERKKASIDMDAAWQRLEDKMHDIDNNESTVIHQPAMRHSSPFMKIAASFIGVLIISGIALATIHIVRQSSRSEALQTRQAPISEQPTTARIATDTITTDTLNNIITYDTIPLEQMLSEIAGNYGVKVRFKNKEARKLRFHFVWNRTQGIEDVVDNLNHFERLHVTLKEDLIIIE